MITLEAGLSRHRMILLVAMATSLLGLWAWFSMPRQEDPSFPERQGMIVTAFPGADAETIERLVLKPLEDELAEVEQIEHVESTARGGVVLSRVAMRDDVENFDEAWDDIREAVERARREFPDGVARPQIRDNLIETTAVLVGITGSEDLLELAHAAELVKDALLTLGDVKRVDLVADPGEQITVGYDDATARKLGLRPSELARQLTARNRPTFGGSIHSGGMTTVVRPQTELQTLEEIRSTPIMLPAGSSVPLAEIAAVHREPSSPLESRMRVNGATSVGLGVVARDNVNTVALGKAAHTLLESVRARVAPLELEVVAFQPDRVEERLNGLALSLVFGVAIVGGVLVLAMGVRLGLVVAAIIPMVTLSALALYSAGGGALHQMSIAALVIALGLLVDNGIVVAESIQARIDMGLPPVRASLLTVRTLAFPLFAATGTTLAAFMPNLVAGGPVGDFTRSLPIVVIVTLVLSYVFAVLVTPTLAAMFLKPRRHTTDSFAVVGRFFGRVAVQRSRWILVVTLTAVALAALAAPRVERRFFPYAGRDQLVIQLEASEGSHLSTIDAVARQMESALLERGDVVQVAAFVGSSAPHFYYNLQVRPNAPHLAELIVRTRDASDNLAVAADIRAFAAEYFPEVIVVVKRLDQGPPVPAPIEIRVYGDQIADLHEGANAVLRRLNAIPGTIDVRHDATFGSPSFDVHLNDAAAERRAGLSRVTMGLSLKGQTRGWPAGSFRRGDDPVPLLVRSPQGEHLSPSDLATAELGAGRVPLEQVAATQVTWRPASIRRRDRRRMTSVYAELEAGVTFAGIARAFDSAGPLALPAGVEVEHGGKVDGSGRANRAIMSGLPITAAMLVLFLMLEFNSFRRVAIILVTLPLAGVGVIPGLLLTGQPLGFMSLLGLFALMGIVVNNAIVLVDDLEQRRAKGAELDPALVETVASRARPILLTTATTVLGLLPLALSDNPLWPPMAWSIIAGLLASTFLSLVVIPALYRVVFRRNPAGGAR